VSLDPIALAQAGPVAILIVGFALFFRAVIKGDLVPGHVYLAEREQRMKAETQAERNADALAALAKIAADANGGGGRG
jgi:hypothetical protein